MTTHLSNHRFISQTAKTFKIHIHTPDDEVLHRSVGYSKIGEKEGLKVAIKLRNDLGKLLWKKYWPEVLKNDKLLLRLPHSLDPVIVYKPAPTKTDPNHRIPCYLAKWKEYDESGNYKLKTVVRSINKYGKLAAYTQTKMALLEAHKDVIPLLEFMERYSITKLV
ncbi:Fe3+-citrate ABC transporter substrate-binding protein [Vibrio sp. R78045]|uniref:Fe3+-citrate ABC transporter substrate-binding protein n=1 Tax=Vibrio sp. R78045 TaxID=3093868 RepID=UPI0036F3AF7C